MIKKIYIIIKKILYIKTEDVGPGLFTKYNKKPNSKCGPM